MQQRRFSRPLLKAACAILLAVIGVAAPASAQTPNDNAGNPMTFRWGEIRGGDRAIFADGDFVPETAAAFQAFLRRSDYTPDTRIYLNSLGGDLKAGMDVGRIIRDVHLNTGVARNSRDPDTVGGIDPHADTGVYPGYCISACALAFLGGVDRRVDPGATYAVHQVSLNCTDRREARARFPWLLVPGVTYCPELKDALAMVQEASGAVVAYVTSMGADPIFLNEMAKAGPKAINALTEDQLNAYKINFTLRNESWAFETDAQGQFFLRYTLGDEWKQDRIDFLCDRSDGPRLFLALEHDTRRSTRREDPRDIIDALAPGVALIWQTRAASPEDLAEVRSASLEPFEIIEPAKATEYENVAMTLDLSQRFLEVLTTSEKLQIAADNPDAPTTPTFVLVTLTLDRDKIASMVRSCR